MKVTLHAAERLLQRVFKMKDYTRQDIYRAVKLLERDTANIFFNNYRKNIVLPSFSNYEAVMIEQTMVTIINKSNRRGVSC